MSKSTKPNEISPLYDQAIELIATGHTQKRAAEEIGICRFQLNKVLRSEVGQARFRYHISLRLTSAAPLAVSALTEVLNGENGSAKIRAVEAVLDRSGFSDSDVGSMRFGDLNVTLNLSPRTKKF